MAIKSLPKLGFKIIIFYEYFYHIIDSPLIIVNSLSPQCHFIQLGFSIILARGVEMLFSFFSS
jgi:hypothetical protein